MYEQTFENFLKVLLPAGSSPHPWQEEFIKSFNDFKPNEASERARRFLVIGAVGAAKTFTAAAVIIWLVTRYPLSQIAIVSETKGQAEQNSFFYVRQIAEKFYKKEFQILKEKITHKNGSEITLRSFNKASETSLRGLHSKGESAVVGVVVDEAAAFGQSLFYNISGIHTDALSFEMIMSNTPQLDSGTFLGTLWINGAGIYNRILITNESLNQDASRVKFSEESSLLYGEMYDMSLLPTTLGLVPGFVSFSQIKELKANYVEKSEKYTAIFPVMGIDCSSSVGLGKHAIAIRDGNYLAFLKTFSASPEELSEIIEDLFVKFKVRKIYLDACGVGNLVHKYLSMRAQINKVFSNANSKHSKYESLRAILAERMLRWLNEKDSSAAFNASQTAILTRYSITYGDKVTATPKRELLKTSDRYAMDAIDAFMYTFAHNSSKLKDTVNNFFEKNNYKRFGL